MKRMTERCDGCGKIPGAIGGPVLDRLCEIEDALGEEYDLERVKELALADREGRVKILEEYRGEVCGTCEHYKQVHGTKHGTCDVRKWPRDRWGREWDKCGRFMPNGSRRACKDWKRKEKREEGIV